MTDALLDVDEIRSLPGRTHRSTATADRLALRRMLARWHRDERDPRTQHPYPRVERRPRPCGGLEWAVRRADLEQYFPAWFTGP